MLSGESLPGATETCTDVLMFVVSFVCNFNIEITFWASKTNERRCASGIIEATVLAL